MSFLAPLFLLGGLAITLPLLFHLIRRSVKERNIFSSLMFLLPSTPRLTRRSRLEHLLLLALRCAVVCLLAAGFARPFLKGAFPPSQPAGPAKRVLVLLDTSASMRRQELWSAARAKAEEHARKAGVGDEVGLFTFDRQLRPLLSFDQWNQTAAGDRLPVVRSRLADARPGWGSTALDTALTRAAELFSDTAKGEFQGQRQIVLISDFQEGSRMTALQGHQWPKGVQVVQERVVPRRANNASLQLVTETAGVSASAETAVRVRVSNASDSKIEQFHVGWADARGGLMGTPVPVYVPAGQSRIASLSVPDAKLVANRILLTGDDEPFDNVVWTIPPEKSEASIVYIGEDLDEDPGKPLFFLQRALQDTPRQAIRIIPDRRNVPLSRAQIDGAALFVVTGTPKDAQIAMLKEALSRGKTVLAAPISPEAASALGKILETELPPAREQKVNGYAMLADIDFAHPLFAPFADPRFSDFTKLHFWGYRKMEFSAIANAQTLARFDTGDPAIVSIAAGKGRVFVFTSGWHPSDSQLALSSKFVPLLYSIIELSGAVPPAPAQYSVGAALPLPPGERSRVGSVQLPNGGKAELKPGETNFVALEPGIYSSASSHGRVRFAVNLEPAESRTAPMPADELERLGVPGIVSSPVAASDTIRKVRLQNTELEARQKLWRWLIVATLTIVGLETWLAGRTTRQATVREEIS